MDCSGDLGLLFAFLAGTRVIRSQSKLSHVISATNVPAGQPITLAADRIGPARPGCAPAPARPPSAVSSAVSQPGLPARRPGPPAVR
jgi:hypothetical protein